jgi:hypothetical protein
MSSSLLSTFRDKNFQEFEQLLASGKFNPDTNLGLGINKKQNLLVYICNSISETQNPSNLIFMELLLKYGADPNIRCLPPSVGYKAPLTAVLEKLSLGEHVLSYLKLLLDFGADPNFDQMVNTIVYLDVGDYCVTALRYVLEAGAFKNISMNSFGWLPIDSLKIRIENPKRYGVNDKNLSVIVAMKELLEKFDDVSSNLFSDKRKAVAANVISYKNDYAQKRIAESVTKST